MSKTEISVTKPLPSRAVVQGGHGDDLTGRLQTAASGREVVSFALASQVWSGMVEGVKSSLSPAWPI